MENARDSQDPRNYLLIHLMALHLAINGYAFDGEIRFTNMVDYYEFVFNNSQF
jgi:hypothetical protein